MIHYTTIGEILIHILNKNIFFFIQQILLRAHYVTEAVHGTGTIILSKQKRQKFLSWWSLNLTMIFGFGSIHSIILPFIFGEKAS